MERQALEIRHRILGKWLSEVCPFLNSWLDLFCKREATAARNHRVRKTRGPSAPPRQPLRKPVHSLSGPRDFRMAPASSACSRDRQWSVLSSSWHRPNRWTPGRWQYFSCKPQGKLCRTKAPRSPEFSPAIAGIPTVSTLWSTIRFGWASSRPIVASEVQRHRDGLRSHDRWLFRFSP
jgi:hypothetical protein